MWVQQDKLYVVGGNGLKEYDLDYFNEQKRWNAILENTRENAVIMNGLVYMCSYGDQLGSYSYEDQTMVHLIEGLEDFPKGMYGLKTESGTSFLLVGGRGGYLSVYLSEGDALVKLRELHLV